MADTTTEIMAEEAVASGGTSLIGGALKLLAAGALVALGGDLYRSGKGFVQNRRNVSEAIEQAKKDGELEAYRNMASGGKKKNR